MTDASANPVPELWIEENQRGLFRLVFRVKETLFSGRSDFQQIDIVDTEGFGRMLFNDGMVMVSERDEHIYHEMIAHVPMFVHPNVKRVLVIGGGDGGTVREVVRHPSVEYCRLVEIDPVVVEGCKQHIRQTSAALDHPKVEVTIEDGVKYVADTSDSYDLVIVDSTDPIGPAVPLFGDEFYANVHRILGEQGIVVSQAESPFYGLDKQKSLVEVLSRRFQRVHVYNYTNMTYPGGLWSFSFSCKGDLCPIVDFAPARVRASGLDFKYYTETIHRAAFILPEFQRKAVVGSLTPFKVPLFAE